MSADNEQNDGEQLHGQSGLSRREVMRRGAVIGGAAVWAVPTVQTIGMRGAFAAGTPREECCHADALGLYVNVLNSTVEESLGRDGCVLDSSDLQEVVNQDGVVVRARIVCGESDGQDPCNARASIAELDISILTSLTSLTVHAETLVSEAHAPCDPCNTRGDSTVQSLTVNGLAVDVTGECNLDVLSLGLVTFNRQQCDDETLNVDALFIHVDGIATVIASHSEAGADSCPCRACA